MCTTRPRNLAALVCRRCAWGRADTTERQPAATRRGVASDKRDACAAGATQNQQILSGSCTTECAVAARRTQILAGDRSVPSCSRADSVHMHCAPSRLPRYSAAIAATQRSSGARAGVPRQNAPVCKIDALRRRVRRIREFSARGGRLDREVVSNGMGRQGRTQARRRVAVWRRSQQTGARRVIQDR